MNLSQTLRFGKTSIALEKRINMPHVNITITQTEWNRFQKKEEETVIAGTMPLATMVELRDALNILINTQGHGR